MLSWIFCLIFFCATVQLSYGDENHSFDGIEQVDLTPGVIPGLTYPDPMPNFQIHKALGQWYNKYLKSPPFPMSCQRIRSWPIHRNKFRAYFSRVRTNGEARNFTLSANKISPGVYETTYDGREGVTMTFLDTDYSSYMVVVFTHHGNVIMVSIDGRNRSSLPQTTLSKIWKKLRAQNINYSAVRPTRNIC